MVGHDGYVSGTRWWDTTVTSVGHDGGTRWLLQWDTMAGHDGYFSGTRWWDTMVTSVGHDGAAVGHDSCCTETRWLLQWDTMVAAVGHDGCCSETRWLLQWDTIVAAVGHDGCCSGTRWLLLWRACGQRDCGSDGRRQLLPCWPAGQDFCPRISCYLATVWPSGQNSQAGTQSPRRRKTHSASDQ